jgi:hypothetical protein
VFYAFCRVDEFRCVCLHRLEHPFGIAIICQDIGNVFKFYFLVFLIRYYGFGLVLQGSDNQPLVVQVVVG